MILISFQWIYREGLDFNLLNPSLLSFNGIGKTAMILDKGTEISPKHFCIYKGKEKSKLRQNCQKDLLFYKCVDSKLEGCYYI